MVMPDWLCKDMPLEAEIECDNDDAQAERDWMASCVRMFTADDKQHAHLAKPPEKYRLTTAWWLLMLDTFLYLRCSAGLEALSSPETVGAARRFMTEAMAIIYMMQFPDLCRSTRWAWQWLGISIDQCSVGVCGCNFLRNGLKLLIEPLYDGVHGIHRDIYQGLHAQTQLRHTCIHL